MRKDDVWETTPDGAGGVWWSVFFSQMPCSFSYKITYKMDTRILSLYPLSSVTIFFFFVFSNLKIFHLKNQRKENHLWSSDFKLLRGNKSCKKNNNNKGHPGSSIHHSTVNRRVELRSSCLSGELWGASDSFTSDCGGHGEPVSCSSVALIVWGWTLGSRSLSKGYKTWKPAEAGEPGLATQGRTGRTAGFACGTTLHE